MLMRRFCRSRFGVSAVEFALVAPLLMLVLFGVVCFSLVFSIASGLQQLAAEAARASVAGLSDTERSQLVQNFVAANVSAYPFLVQQRLAVATTSVTTPSPAFRVSLTYDLTSQIGQFSALLPVPLTRVQRTAIVLTGSSL
jgi:Flp pilus assembly protein TadG